MKKSCDNCMYSDRPSYKWPCTVCVSAYDITPSKWEASAEYKPMTNGDRIRSMTDKEMATDLLGIFEEVCEDGVPCEEWMLMWLKKPAEE